MQRAGIIFAASVLVWTANTINNHIAERRANEVVAAVNAYRATTGNWPGTLDQLVPVYLARVPLAKYTISNNSFTYVPGDAPTLMWTEFPPFGRPYFTFGEDGAHWKYLD